MPVSRRASIERAGEFNHLFHRSPITSAAKRIVRILLERNVQDRAEVEVKSEQTQQFSSDPTMFPNEGRITFFSELPGVWRLVSDEFEARDPATLLVDGDDRLDPRQISQVLDKLSKLRRGVNVTPKENITSGLHLAENAGSLRIHLQSRHTNEQKLT